MSLRCRNFWSWTPCIHYYQRPPYIHHLFNCSKYSYNLWHHQHNLIWMKHQPQLFKIILNNFKRRFDFDPQTCGFWHINVPCMYEALLYTNLQLFGWFIQDEMMGKWYSNVWCIKGRWRGFNNATAQWIGPFKQQEEDNKSVRWF